MRDLICNVNNHRVWSFALGKCKCIWLHRTVLNNHTNTRDRYQYLKWVSIYNMSMIWIRSILQQQECKRQHLHYLLYMTKIVQKWLTNCTIRRQAVGHAYII